MRASPVAARSIAGLLLVLCLVSACGKDQVEQAYVRGAQAFAQGDAARALEDFNEAVRLDSNRAQGYLGRGMVYWSQRKYEAALPDLNRAIALQPDLTWAYYYRGASLMSLRRFEAGLSDFTRVTASDELPVEDLVRAHRWRAIALLNLERYEEAVGDFTRCVDLQPDEPFHYYERGRVYDVVGRTDQAVADYERYLALSEVENEVTQEVRERLSALTTPAPE